VRGEVQGSLDVDERDHFRDGAVVLEKKALVRHAGGVAEVVALDGHANVEGMPHQQGEEPHPSPDGILAALHEVARLVLDGAVGGLQHVADLQMDLAGDKESLGGLAGCVVGQLGQLDVEGHLGADQEVQKAVDYVQTEVVEIQVGDAPDGLVALGWNEYSVSAEVRWVDIARQEFDEVGAVIPREGIVVHRAFVVDAENPQACYVVQALLVEDLQLRAVAHPAADELDAETRVHFEVQDLLEEVLVLFEEDQHQEKGVVVHQAFDEGGAVNFHGVGMYQELFAEDLH